MPTVVRLLTKRYEAQVQDRAVAPLWEGTTYAASG